MSVRYFGDKQVSQELFNEQLVNFPPAIIGVDLETISLKERIPIGFAIAVSPTDSWYFRTFPIADPEIELVRPLLNSPKVVKVFHNAIFDLRVFPLIYQIDESAIADTNVMARLLGYQETKLPILSLELLNKILDSTDTVLSPKQTMLDVPYETIAAMCASHAAATLQLYHQFVGQVDKDYLAVEMKVIPILIDMSLRGMKVNQEDRARVEIKLEQEVAYYKSICEAEDFNPASNQQVGYMLAKRGSFLPFTRSKRNLKVDVEQLEFLEDPLAQAVLGFRKANKRLTTYIKPLAGEERIYTSYNLDAVVGRVSSSGRNLQNIPPEDRFIFMPDSGTYTTGDFSQEHLYILMYKCLYPATRVLKANLTWTAISDIVTGDKLVSIDESPLSSGSGSKRKLRLATVTSTSRLVDKAFAVVFDNDQVVIASGNHPWLRTNRPATWKDAQTRVDWIETRNITVGTRVKFLCKPWEVDNSREGGYLAGLLDGEGSAIKDTISFSQQPGIVMEEYKALMKLRGFKLSNMKSDHHVDTHRVDEMLRLLGTIRPMRLLEKGKTVWEGIEPRGKPGFATVTNICSFGQTELINIETDTHTFVAEGFFTHNSGDKQMERVYYEGEAEGDIHLFTARELNIPRRLAKTINYALLYGATAKTISFHSKIKDLKRCSRLLDKWFETFRDAAEWIKGVQEEGLRTGWSEPTLFGRRIKIPEEINHWGRIDTEGMKRKAVNYPILGSDGEIMKRALIICERERLPLAVTVHDSITLDGDCEFPVEELEHIAPVRIPLKVSKSKRWE